MNHQNIHTHIKVIKHLYLHCVYVILIYFPFVNNSCEQVPAGKNNINALTLKLKVVKLFDIFK